VSAAAPPLRSRAFGLDLTAHFAMPGVEPEPSLDGSRPAELRLAELAEVESGWPHESAQRITELHFADGSTAVSVDWAGELGLLAHAFDFGTARIAADGGTVLIARADEPDWVWQRYLTGQVLPLLALLQGLEVFHASVLVRERQAIAIVASSGTGKTTLALHLALAGLGFASDDVLAVELLEDGLLAHPGLGLANVRPGGDELLGRLAAHGLASPIGANERETRIAIRRHPDPTPLRALFFLTRYSEPRELLFERLAPVDPRLLLAATFNLSWRTPDRLERQLDVCARLDRTADVVQIHCGRDVPADEVAQGVLDESARLLG
jgi:hypothetical protein